MCALGASTGWKTIEKLSDFPIDLYLLNAHSNYKIDPKNGKEANKCRLILETEMAARGIEKITEFRRGCAAVGIGRNSVIYFGKK